MKLLETALKECYILEPTVYEDHRGYFFESFNEDTFEKLTGQRVHFVQDNQSFSTHGVLRGLHAQKGEHAQAKLIRVLQGQIRDVVVDARPDSETFGQHIAVELSAENKLQFFVPRGFLHGFVVLSETASISYKCDNRYYKASEYGVRFDDDTLAIDWALPHDTLVLSDKDLALPTFKEIANRLTV